MQCASLCTSPSQLSCHHPALLWEPATNGCCERYSVVVSNLSYITCHKYIDNYNSQSLVKYLDVSGSCPPFLSSCDKIVRSIASSGIVQQVGSWSQQKWQQRAYLRSGSASTSGSTVPSRGFVVSSIVIKSTWYLYPAPHAKGTKHTLCL